MLPAQSVTPTLKSQVELSWESFVVVCNPSILLPRHSGVTEFQASGSSDAQLSLEIKSGGQKATNQAIKSPAKLPKSFQRTELSAHLSPGKCLVRNGNHGRWVERERRPFTEMRYMSGNMLTARHTYPLLHLPAVLWVWVNVPITTLIFKRWYRLVVQCWNSTIRYPEFRSQLYYVLVT